MSPHKYIKEMILALKDLDCYEFYLHYTDNIASQIKLYYREPNGELKSSIIKDMRTPLQRRRTVERLNKFIATQL